MTLTQVRLARDSLETPWGFRLQGGKDFENQPLTVQRVFANTPSEGELHRGDVIVTINGRDVSSLTHKQAQDAITKGGGQIEFLVQRPPPGQVYVKPLSPTKEVRAPAFPPTKAPQIVIPIQRRSGPQSPTRVIPISPHKPSPPKTSPKPSPKPRPQSAPYSDSSAMAGAAGHIPTKVTLNKYGGSPMSFGTSFGSPPATAYRPVAAPQPTYQPAPVQAQPPTYQPAPVQAQPPVQDHYDYPFQQSQTQFSAPHTQMSPPAEGERGVAEEEYGGVGDRRKLFLKGAPAHQPVRRSHKPLPTFGRARPGEEPVSYGVDYTKPQTHHTTASKPSKPRQRPPAVNSKAQDESELSWSGTLRGDKRHLKPWELEALEAEKYQQATVDQPYRPSMVPAPAPKPKITQIMTESRARPAEQSASGTKQPVPIGDRDWNDSYVYQMVHSTQKTTSSSRQDVPGQAPQGETVTTTRTAHETRYPGQEPQRHVTETVQRGGVPDYRINAAIGMSDF